ncbi:hypothetical protein [Spirosoma sordidisoli]|uniref:Uncharacterized protein n=1 Tax=Spirosoma sordidisoli TaxID=2502893 RepID=A0A4Q2UG47_9BACT|nr:hypothetical protein [Spirosoma sordidisoli]RYC66355.1 hypothetical protein EQG79_30240 [Spirosoma sordidisoli]
MIRCFLDNQEVASPQGLDYLQFKKVRHRTFWGFTYRQLGFVDGLNSLDFAEPRTVDYLRAVYARHGVLGQTRFRIESDSEGTLYDGWINYSQSQRNPGRFAVALRDDQATAQLESQSVLQYALAVRETIALAGRPLDGPANLTLDALRAVVSTSLAQPRALAHSLPVMPVSDKEQPVAGRLVTGSDPLARTPCYINETPGPLTVSLRGSFSVNPQASAGGLVTYRLRVGGVTQPLAQLSLADLAGSGSVKTVAIDRTLTVPPGESLYLEAVTDAELSRYVFTYSAVRLALERVEASPPSVALGLSVRAALIDLIGQLTDHRLRVQVEGLDDLFLTNGACLRGVPRPLLVSLRSLFEGLNGLFNLQLDCQGGTVFIRPKAHLWTKGQRSAVNRVTGFIERPNLELIPSEIRLGFQQGAAANLISGLEVHTARVYGGEVTTERNPLDITSALIGSSSRIEQQRRKQFEASGGGSTRNDADDEALFVICTAGLDPAGHYRPAGLTGIDHLAGLIDAPTTYNLRITPRRCLERWRWLLTGSGRLRLVSSELRAEVSSRYATEAALLSENQAVIDQARTIPDAWLVKAAQTMAEFHSLRDWVGLADGRVGLLMEATWRYSDSGPTTDLLLWDVPPPPGVAPLTHSLL